MHGFDPVTQTSPRLELPFKIPFTVHVTAVSGVFVTLAPNVALCVTVTLAVDGKTLTATLLVIVTVPETTAEPSVA